MKSMNKLELLEKLSINYQVIPIETHRLMLKYNRNGVLVIRCPNSMKEDELNDFIKRHIRWIKNHQPSSNPNEVTHQNERMYLYLGHPYTLNTIESRHEGVFLNQDRNELIVYANNLQNVKSLIKKWKMEQCEIIFTELFYQCFKDMERYLAKFPHLEIKHYLSRWGCCYPKKNLIILNNALIHTDIEIIKYVIYHELAHLKYPNHQKEFHLFLRLFCPNEKELRKKLKNYTTEYD